jgi:ATP-dependent Clp protease protease subunit
MYDIRNSGDSSDTLDIYIYSDIDNCWWDESTMSADKFRKELDKHKDAKQINLYINSMGGSVSEGVTIYNQIRRHSAKVTAYIDGFACSIASVIPMAADEVIMGENTMLMIHNPWTFTYGNAKALRKTAEDLDKVRDGCIIPAYKARCGDKLSDEKLIELLDDETFLTAAECLEYGLCDRILTVSNEEKKTEAEDKVKAAMNHAKEGFMDNFIEKFGSMVAKAKAIENPANAVKNDANAETKTEDADKTAAESAESAAEKQQDDVTDTNDGNINDNGSEPTKEEKTPEPAEDNKAKVNDYFMKLLKGEI